MCELIGSSHPNPDGSFSSSDALSTFPKERATRAMFAYLIDGAVADELEVINDTSNIPDLGDRYGTRAILRLYGAGILVGVDKTGRFHGDVQSRRRADPRTGGDYFGPGASAGSPSAPLSSSRWQMNRPRLQNLEPGTVFAHRPQLSQEFSIFSIGFC